MDNRLKFLYYDDTELWGRRKRALPGMEIPGQAGQEPWRQIRMAIRGRDVYRTKSREVCELSAEKSRYCYQRTRTVNRHRWMRRES